MKLSSTPLEGLLIVEPSVFKDERGSFFESYQEKKFQDAGISAHFIQDNQSTSKLNVIRGLHFQMAPFAQGKLVRVVKGRALDVALDIRPESKTFGRYYSIELNSSEIKMLWIPPGFAHGFSVLEENTIFSYKVDAPYSKEHERGIRFDDPEIGIDWKVINPIVSDKDKLLPTFREYIHHLKKEGIPPIKSS